MGKKNKKRGTKRVDKLTGTSGKDIFWGLKGDDVLTTFEGNDKVYGGKGDDVITTGIGMDKAWGGKGKDLFVTEDGGEGHVKIMDFEVGDRIQFCGCANTRKEQRGKNVWIIKGDDVKAVIKGVDADDIEVDYTGRMITLMTPAADPLA
ncbi:hypothetical protein [Synechococcus sp. RS9902]|uniref:hypothetical protein n=1 Tax=Synechococcus sp. RS9902 TaxID=221345 RepID=UPI0016493BBD|nr:serralysin-like metalloprotease C-terminal domain-containing protein [Synechococcus sp. RS9902]